MLRILAALFCGLILVGCESLTDPSPARTGGDADAAKAQQLFESRQFAEAIPLLESALHKPLQTYNKGIVLTMIGNCYTELDQPEKSLEYHDQAISEDPANHQPYVNKGIAYRLLGEYDKAAECYSTALKLAPDYAELHASMGALSFFRNDYDTAVKHLERSIELDDSLAVAHSNLALAYANVDRFEEADQQLQIAIKLGYHQPHVIKERIDELRQQSDEK